ncbi:MAG: aldehyde dehydrogenase family protein [Geodermatophilaceae bacterium]
MITRDKFYIDGRWVAPAGHGAIDVMNPVSEQVIARVPEGISEDIHQAVTAAAEARASWAASPLTERVKYALAISERLQARSDDLVETIISELGSPRELTRIVHVGAAIEAFSSTAALADEIAFEEPMGDSLVVREAIGVVGCITPWNYPLLQIAAKIAPALVAGCTVILKPSEVTPLNAYLLTDAIHEANLPRGVFNLVIGYGPVAGEALAAHPLVDMVSFTGSTRAGRRVAELAAATVKKTALELGGKSPNIILDDLDGPALEDAVNKAIRSAFPNSGQNCGALSRMLVPKDKIAEVEELAVRAAEALTIGDPSDPGTQLGPLVSEAQRERVRSYIRKGVEEGARLLTGGAEAPVDLEVGYYVQPTIFTDVSPDMTVAREEIFGPVLSILSYEDEEDAIRQANDTDYGLSAAVRSRDPKRAQRVARQIRAGQIMVNDGRRTGMTPFGGMKLSGYGRESGRYGLEEFLVTKALHL